MRASWRFTFREVCNNLGIADDEMNVEYETEAEDDTQLTLMVTVKTCLAQTGFYTLPDLTPPEGGSKMSLPNLPEGLLHPRTN